MALLARLTIYCVMIPRRVVRLLKHSKYTPHATRTGQICRVDIAGKDWLHLTALERPPSLLVADLDGVEDVPFDSLTPEQNHDYFKERP
jgi:hypothetical protein